MVGRGVRIRTYVWEQTGHCDESKVAEKNAKERIVNRVKKVRKCIVKSEIHDVHEKWWVGRRAY